MSVLDGLELVCPDCQRVYPATHATLLRCHECQEESDRRFKAECAKHRDTKLPQEKCPQCRWHPCPHCGEECMMCGSHPCPDCRRPSDEMADDFLPGTKGN